MASGGVTTSDLLRRSRPREVRAGGRQERCSSVSTGQSGFANALAARSVVSCPLIIDTDVGTDVDDALALAFAVRHPDIDPRAVVTVSGDTRRRARIAERLLPLAATVKAVSGIAPVIEV